MGEEEVVVKSGKKVTVKCWSGMSGNDSNDASRNYNTYKIWDDASFEGFTKKINGGLGELNIKLARPFDNYGEGEDVVLNNRVQIIVNHDKTAPQGKTIYNGYIAEINPWADGHDEGVNLKCLGYISKFSDWLHIKDASSAPMAYRASTSTYSGVDISGIVSAVVNDVPNTIDKDEEDPQMFFTKEIANTGKTVSFVFALKNKLDILRMCQKSYSSFYFYLDPEKFYWRAIPDHPTHTFIYGKHINGIGIKRSMLNIGSNLYYCWNGNQFSDGTASDSPWAAKSHAPEVIDGLVWKYGIRDKVMEIRSDADGVAAENVISSDYNRNDTPQIQLTFKIADLGINSRTGYDIDSIDPGNTCQILNLPPSINNMLGNNNLIIRQVDYTLDEVKLDIALDVRDLSEEVAGSDLDEQDLRRVESPEFEIMV